MSFLNPVGSQRVVCKSPTLKSPEVILKYNVCVSTNPLFLWMALASLDDQQISSFSKYW